MNARADFKAAVEAAALAHRREETKKRNPAEVWAAAHQLIRDMDLDIGLRIARGEEVP